jgi:hypothetical protein
MHTILAVIVYFVLGKRFVLQLYRTSTSHVKITRKKLVNHGSVMSIDLQLIRNAHVLSVCSPDSDVLIFGSDTSELQIDNSVTIVITFVPLYNIIVNISTTTLNLQFTKYELN